MVGYSEDKSAYGVPIGTAVTATEQPTGETTLLQVNEAVFLTRNAKSLLSFQQVMDYGVLVNDVPHKYGGNQDIYVEYGNYFIPLSPNHNAIEQNSKRHKLEFSESQHQSIICFLLSQSPYAHEVN